MKIMDAGPKTVAFVVYGDTLFVPYDDEKNAREHAEQALLEIGATSAIEGWRLYTYDEETAGMRIDFNDPLPAPSDGAKSTWFFRLIWGDA